MTKPKKEPSGAPAVQRKRAPYGGRFIRDPKTGELECVERMKPAGNPEEEAPAAEPGSDQADTSGDEAGSGSGSTAGDGAEQEG